LGATDDVRGNTGSEILCHWNADTFANDQYCQVSIASALTGNDVGPASRVAVSAETGYIAPITSGGCDVYKVIAAAFTRLGGNSTVVAVNDVMRLEASGTAISLKRNGSAFLGPFTDSAIASGSGGMWFFVNTTRLDNFEAGNLAGGGITGTEATTLGAATLSAAGQLAITATEATTLGALTLSATGAGAGITGTEATTLGSLTMAASGQLAISASEATTLGALTLSAAATLAISGTEATTLGAVTLAANAMHGTPITGTAATTLGALTVSSAAQLAISGAEATTLQALTLAANGTLAGGPITGTAAVTLGAVTLTSLAQVVIVGAATIQLGALRLAATQSPLVIELAYGFVYGAAHEASVYGPNDTAEIGRV
jgi:hypothetical protein